LIKPLVNNAIIFDFDGLILDTETTTFEAWREIYREHGHPLTIETWAQCVGSDHGGYDPERELEKLIGRKLLWEMIHSERRERVMGILSQMDPLPGVRDRLQEARELKVSCAVASSSPRWWVEHWLNHLGLREAFENVTCLEDTGKAKPHPGLFQHAAAKLGAAPDAVIVLEDSLHGLHAARAAQMRCVIVPCPMTAHLAFEGAWRQHESLADFRLVELIEGAARP
jgi:HAD superfamily hydrolase (TIGR01509 family)